MANERLRTALLQRGLTPAELADTVGVDPKTIERWIGGRIPYRRHRYQVAAQLGVDETYLWPDALAAEQVASASESEILTVYPHRWAVPARHLGAAVRLAPSRRSASWSTAACSSPTTPACSRCSARRPSRACGSGSCSATPTQPEVAVRGAARGHRRRAGRQDPQRARAPTGRCANVDGVEIRLHAHGALQLDLPRRRRAAGQHARLRHAGLAGAGAAPAADRRRRRWSAPTWTASSGSGRSPDPSTEQMSDDGLTGRRGGSTTTTTPTRPPANSLVPSANVVVVNDARRSCC